MRNILIGIVILALLLAGLVFFGPTLVPKEVYRNEIAKAVESATGRSLTIEGDVNLKVFPSLKARVEGAKLANMEGGEAPNMAEIGAMDVGVALWPLLSRQVEITNFTLNDAVIHLEVDRSGRANWDFAKTSAPQAEETPSGEETQPSLDKLKLGDVRLVNGRVTYKNAKDGGNYEVTDINSEVSLPSIDEPFTLDGELTYNKEPLDIDIRLARPRAALEGGESQLSATVKGAPVKFTYDGNIIFGEAVALRGRTSLDADSARRLAAWAGTPIEAEKGFGPLSISGDMSADGSKFTFANAALRFDGIKASGALKGDLSGKVPYLSGILTTDLLDLRPYIAPTEGAGGTPAGQSGGGWSTEPIDTSVLRAFNGDLKFKAGGILLRDLTIGKSDLGIKIANGVLTADLSELSLYKGLAKGSLTLDGRQSRTILSTNLQLVGLDLEGFLKDFAKSERFLGTGLFEINLTAAGRSQADIVSSLAGKAGFKFSNGAVRGVDLVKIARIVNQLSGKEVESQSGTVTEAGQNAEDQTRFVEMGGNFAVASGIMKNVDFKMINELISLTGQGNIDLPRQWIDFRLDPGKSQEDGGLKVALRIKGPLSKPSITPDASQLIRDEIEEQLGDSPIGSILNEVLGGGEKPKEDGGTPSDGTPKAPISGESILDRVLGKKKPASEAPVSGSQPAPETGNPQSESAPPNPPPPEPVGGEAQTPPPQTGEPPESDATTNEATQEDTVPPANP